MLKCSFRSYLCADGRDTAGLTLSLNPAFARWLPAHTDGHTASRKVTTLLSTRVSSIKSGRLQASPAHSALGVREGPYTWRLSGGNAILIMDTDLTRMFVCTIPDEIMSSSAPRPHGAAMAPPLRCMLVQWVVRAPIRLQEWNWGWTRGKGA